MELRPGFGAKEGSQVCRLIKSFCGPKYGFNNAFLHVVCQVL
jgi:hypothetical protein